MSANEAVSSTRPMLTSRCVGWRSARRPTMAMVTASTRPGRQQDAAHVGRRQAQPHLHVDRQQVGGSEQRDAVDEGHDAAHGETPVGEQRQVHQRCHVEGRLAVVGLQHAPLQQHKGPQGQGRAEQQHAGRAGRVAVQFHQPVEQAQGAHGGQQQAGPVQPGALRVGRRATRRVGGHVAPRQPERGQAERHHHVEDGAPAQPVHEQAADAGADGRRQHHAHAEDAAGAALFVGLESAQDDDGRDRLHHTGGQPFGHAGGQHEGEVLGQATGNATQRAAATCSPSRCGGSRSGTAARAWSAWTRSWPP